MSFTPRRLELVTVEEFVSTRLEGPGAELVNGVVYYAMTGGTDRHNRVSVNAVLALGLAARSLGCELFAHDMGVKISDQTAYYPDVMVVCDSTGDTHLTRTKPCFIIEVASPSTHSIDEREKRVAYLRIPSMHDYLIVHPTDQMVDHHHREEGETWSWTVRNRGDVCRTTCIGDLQVEDLFTGL
jgi:Uma2 family endonuclease